MRCGRTADGAERWVLRGYRAEDRLAAVELYREGATAVEVAEAAGVSRTTVFNWAREGGALRCETPRPFTPGPSAEKRDAPARAAMAEGEARAAAVSAPRSAGAAMVICQQRAARATAAGRSGEAARETAAARGWAKLMQLGVDAVDAPPTAPPSAASLSVRRGPAEAVINPGAVWTPHEAQTPPLVARGGEPWRTWLFTGGRGAGKTRAGAEWLAGLAEADGGARLALVGPTLHDVREVMVDGPSGLLHLPGRERPRWEASRRRLVWSGGAVAQAFSAEDAESLRGPQFTAGWADELCVWPDPAGTLALLRMGVRLGGASGSPPRLCVTTTPKPIAALRALMAEPGCAVTRAGTVVNAANLSPAFLEGVEALYGGTRLARQEIEGVLVEGEGALWRAEELAGCRGARPERLDRVVVAVDPPASAGGDACGIVVAGRRGDRAFVLDDRTAAGLSPLGWARRVAEAAADWGARAVVAEANQGGEMVRATLAGVLGAGTPVKLVHASRAKRARAEPVAALYEQGRVVHCGAFAALEEEMMALGAAERGRGPSPDRADALVWALTELMLEGAGGAQPRIRML